MEIKDSMKIKKIIADFPNQFKIGVEKGKNVIFKKNFQRLIFCGMGGSALAPEILRIYFFSAKLKIPIIIHRDYNLPFNLRENDLVFFISYSGKTEETLSAFKKSLTKKISSITISSGGDLEKLSKKYKIPHVLIPSGIPPRFSFGYQLGAILKILDNSKIINFDFKKNLKIDLKELEILGKKTALLLRNKIPIIYSSFLNFPLALLWKIKFNENSKIPSFCNYFPELNHNEMIGFSQKGKEFFIIFLVDEKEKKEILKRMKLTAEILTKKKIKVKFINILGKNFLEKIFNNFILASWTSYYLAQYYQIDPGPVEMVEQFKKLLKKN